MVSKIVTEIVFLFVFIGALSQKGEEEEFNQLRGDQAGV